MPTIHPIGVLGSAADVAAASTASAEGIAAALQAFPGMGPTDSLVVERAWQRLRAAHWMERFRGQLCHDRYSAWAPVLVVRATKQHLWLIRDQTQMPRVRMVRRTNAGPWLYPMDADSNAIALLCWHDMAVAQRKLLQAQNEYEQRMIGLVGLPVELVEESARQQRARVMAEAKLALSIERAGGELKTMGVDMTPQPQMERGPRPFESDSESWRCGRWLAGRLSQHLRGCTVILPDDERAEREIREYCARLRASGDGVSLARVMRERRLSDEQVVLILLVLLKHYGVPLQDIPILCVGIDPIALTALRMALRRKKSLRELIEFDGCEIEPSSALLDEVNGRIQLKMILRLGEEIAEAGITERPTIPDNKGIGKDESKDGGDTGQPQ